VGVAAAVWLRKKSRQAHADVATESCSSPFEPMLRGRAMPKVFMEEFMLPLDGSHDVLLEGSMDRIWSRRWIRPVLRVMARWNVLFPETGTNIPTTMHIFAGRDRHGRLCHFWNRTFTLPNATRWIDAHLVWEPEREWVAEWMGPGGCFEMAWHVRFLPPDEIEVDARLEAFRIGPLRIPLPRLLQVDAYTVDRADPVDEDVIRCELSLTSPLLGPLCGYEGSFSVRRIARDALAVKRPPKGVHAHARARVYARWLEAAAIYNAIWGVANVLWPTRALRLLGVSHEGPPFAWQTVGMMVGAYAPAYWWASRDPLGSGHLVAVGLAGKILGPLGFVWAAQTRRLPLRFGITILSNDLIWWPTFTAIVRDAAADAGGWRAFLAGGATSDPKAQDDGAT
jgi:small multidrug resistance pump